MRSQKKKKLGVIISNDLKPSTHITFHRRGTVGRLQRKVYSIQASIMNGGILK